MSNTCKVFTASRPSFGVRVERAALGMNMKLTLKGCTRK